jgi:hypothetical protein
MYHAVDECTNGILDFWGVFLLSLGSGGAKQIFQVEALDQGKCWGFDPRASQELERGIPLRASDF